MAEKISKSKSQWREELTPGQFEVCRKIRYGACLCRGLLEKDTGSLKRPEQDEKGGESVTDQG